MGKKTRSLLVRAESVCAGETNKVKLFFFFLYFLWPFMALLTSKLEDMT